MNAWNEWLYGWNFEFLVKQHGHCEKIAKAIFVAIYRIFSHCLPNRQIAAPIRLRRNWLAMTVTALHIGCWNGMLKIKIRVIRTPFLSNSQFRKNCLLLP